MCPPLEHRFIFYTAHVLKGQCHEIFCFRFFSWITFPQAPDNNTRVISNFSKIQGDIRKSMCTTGVNDTGGKLPPVSMSRVAKCHRYQRHRRQILPPVPLVFLTPVANLPPLSTTPAAKVANCHRYQRHRWQICHRCSWHQWQIMGTISGCRNLKVNLKAKIYIYVSSTTQRWPNKIIINFPFATGVVDTGGKPWAANISANFRTNSKRS